MNIIERLKNNTSAFGLMDKELREVAEKIGPEHFLRREFGLWQPEKDGNAFRHRYHADGTTFKLNAAWVCDHREKIEYHYGDGTGMGELAICPWCNAEIKPEPQMEWAEYDVTKLCKHYRFEVAKKNGRSTTYFLNLAPGMIGFGGIKYKAPCECYGGGETDFQLSPPPLPCVKHGPWTPVKVVFWREMK